MKTFFFKKLKLDGKPGFANILVLVGMLVVSVSLPIATKLVQQNQENRSSAASNDSCTTIGETKCTDSTHRGTCKQGKSRNYYSVVLCAYGCSGGACNPKPGSTTTTTTGEEEGLVNLSNSTYDSCTTIGETKCTDSTHRGTCKQGSGGKYYSVVLCAYGCSGGACNSKPGSTKTTTTGEEEGLVNLSNSTYKQLGDSCELTSSCQPPLICGSNKKCENEKITRTGNKKLNQRCDSDSDCISPYVCYENEGVCKSRSGGECLSSTDCYENHYCSDAKKHCRKIDSYWIGDVSVEGESVKSLIYGGSTVKTSTTDSKDIKDSKKTSITNSEDINDSKKTLNTAKTPQTTTAKTSNTEKTASDLSDSTIERSGSYDSSSFNTDVNGDGVTNTIDFSLFKNNFTDVNGDGVTNTIDFSLFKNKFDINVLWWQNR